jgi:hypothetical protein
MEPSMPHVNIYFIKSEVKSLLKGKNIEKSKIDICLHKNKIISKHVV